MFDEDDEDRLLIDDNEQSTELEKPKLSPSDNRVNFTPPEYEESSSTLHEANGITSLSQALNNSREEGELDDDEMDTSCAAPGKKAIDTKISLQTDRKRVNGDAGHSSSDVDPSPKKTKVQKIEKRDQGMCVRSLASQAEVEESVFEMEAGSSFPLQLTVVCRIEGADTLYFSAKWKDRELSGILTDGDPPGFANFAKKRSALNSNCASESEKVNVSTPKKRVRGADSKKKTIKTEEEDDDLDVTGLGDTRDSNSSTGSIKLTEINSTSLHYCTFDCQHAYPSSAELEYHISTVHKKKSVIYEHNSTQTQTDGINKKMISVHTDTEGLEPNRKVKEEGENPTELKEEQPASHYSDISDDIAPVLSKIEEPRTTETVTNGVTSTPSTSQSATTVEQKPQAAIVQPTAATPIPKATNGLLMPAPTFGSPFSAPTSSALTTPNRDSKPPSDTKPTASPAQSRSQSFTPIMAAPGNSQAIHPALQGLTPAHVLQLHMQQMQQMQQMVQNGRAPYPMQPMPSPQDLAAIQAMQNYQLYNGKH